MSLAEQERFTPDFTHAVELQTSDGYVGKSDGREDGVGYFYAFEVQPGLWTDSLTFWTLPGHE